MIDDNVIENDTKTQPGVPDAVARANVAREMNAHNGADVTAGDELPTAGYGSATASREPGLTNWYRRLFGLAPSGVVVGPLGAVGGIFAMALDTLMLIPSRPFAWRELLLQSWFVARVSLLPTLMLAIPFTVLTVFTFNILLVEFGAEPIELGPVLP